MYNITVLIIYINILLHQMNVEMLQTYRLDVFHYLTCDEFCVMLNLKEGNR